MASPPPTPPSSGTPPRKAFALTGRSVTLDPRTHPVRADLADVRLAAQVFAPHYAEAVERRLATDATLRAERDAADRGDGLLGRLFGARGRGLGEGFAGVCGGSNDFKYAMTSSI